MKIIAFISKIKTIFVKIYVDNLDFYIFALNQNILYYFSMNCSFTFPGDMSPNQTLVASVRTPDQVALEKVAAEKPGFTSFTYGTMSKSTDGNAIFPIFATAKDDVLV